MISLSCYGGGGTVTGANFLIEKEDTKILIDCGLTQGSREEIIREFDYQPEGIDYLFITHAHIDHIGLVPKLVKDGFKGKIFSTPETKSIAELMLADMAKITDGNVRRGGTLPIYEQYD